VLDLHRSPRGRDPAALASRSHRGLREGNGVPWSVVAFGALSVAAGIYLAGSVTTSPSPTELRLGAGDEAGPRLAPGPTGAFTAPTALVTATSSPPAPTGAATATPSAAAPATPPSTAPTSVRRAPVASPGRTGTTPSAGPAPTAAANSTCTYHYAFDSVWNGGFTASVTLRNTSPISLTGWDAQFGLSRSVTLREFWGASLEHTGRTVQVTPSSDVGLAAGAAVSFGFNAATTSPVTRLGAFQLAGLPCRKA
jgi:hypothetical protein